MYYFWIYLWTRLDNLIGLFTMVNLLLSMLFAICLIIYFLAKNDSKPTSKETEQATEGDESTPHQRAALALAIAMERALKRIGIALIVFVTLWVTTPSKKDAAIIFLLPKAVSSETAADTFTILNKLPKAIRKELERYLNA
jgi:hypothetical protein